MLLQILHTLLQDVILGHHLGVLLLKLLNLSLKLLELSGTPIVCWLRPPSIGV
jgi:hypothetical protein